jgi:hypothetical protein
MIKESIEFKKKCEIWHSKYKNLLKKGQLDEANYYKNELIKSIEQWRKQEKLVRNKLNTLTFLLSNITREENLKKAEHRKQIRIKEYNELVELENIKKDKER